MSTICPYHQGPRRELVGAGSGQGQAAGRGIRHRRARRSRSSSEDTAVSKSVGTYLQSVLNDLGYKASVKPISSNIQFTYIQNTNNKVQISVSQWYQDYPAASDFLNVLFGCDCFHPGSDASVNISGFCDKDDRREDEGGAELGRHRSGRAPTSCGPRSTRRSWTQAPAAPLFTPKHVDFVSKRVGNFQFNAQYLLDRHAVLGEVAADARRERRRSDERAAGDAAALPGRRHAAGRPRPLGDGAGASSRARPGRHGGAAWSCC